MMDFFESITFLGQIGDTLSMEPEHVASELTGLAGKFGVNWKMLVAQTVNFLVVAYLLHRFAFKPILSTLGERQKRIADGLKYADKMEATLKGAQKQKENILKEAAQEAKTYMEEIREQAKAYLEKETQEAVIRTENLLHNAHQAIEIEREKMLENVQAEVVNCVVDVTEKVLAKHLSGEERKRFAELAGKELQNAKL